MNSSYCRQCCCIVLWLTECLWFLNAQFDNSFLTLEIKGRLLQRRFTAARRSSCLWTGWRRCWSRSAADRLFCAPDSTEQAALLLLKSDTHTCQQMNEMIDIHYTVQRYNAMGKTSFFISALKCWHQCFRSLGRVFIIVLFPYVYALFFLRLIVFFRGIVRCQCFLS